jgi:hypothetical protein
MAKQPVKKLDWRSLPKGPLEPNLMNRMFEPRPRRWRLAFWRKPK